MSGIRTLVIAYDFPPHAAIGTQRTLRFVRHLDAAGWPTAVLTGDPANYRKGTPVDTALLGQVPSGVTVIRSTVLRPLDRLDRSLRGRPASDSPVKKAGVATSSPSVKAGPPSVLRRLKGLLDAVTSIPDAEVGWLLPTVFRGVRFVRRWKPEVIYSSAPPWTGHVAAGLIAQLTGRPWVADFRDPWARAPWRSARAHPLVNRAAAHLEGWAVNKAAAVIFTTEAARAEFAARYGETLSAKFTVVPNGCDAAMFDGIPAADPDQFVLLHAGSLYGGRDPQPLFRAIRSAIAAGRIDRRAFKLQLLGVVALAGADLARTAREMDLADVVELLPRTDHRTSLRSMKAASALLLLQQGTTMSVPAKLYEYMAAGKRIFAICDEGETASLVRGSGAGVVAAASDPQALEDALVALVNARHETHRPADRAFFDGAIGAARTSAIIEALLRTPTSAPAQTREGDVRFRA